MKVESIFITFMLFVRCQSNLGADETQSDTWLHEFKGVKQFAEILRQKPQDDSFENKRQLTDMNIDCIFLILEELDFASLLNVAQINDDFSILAVKVFRQKFSNLTIVIQNYEDNLPKTTGLFSNWDSIGYKPRAEIKAKTSHFTTWGQINIQDCKMILETLKTFGSVIQRLKMVYGDAESIQSEIITKSINKYCAESVIELELHNCKDSVLNYMPKPFKNVNQVVFGGSFQASQSYEALSMEKLFPQVQRLSLILSEFESRFPICYLPHLEHLNVDVNSHYENNVSSFIKHNPQIRSINLHNPSPKVLDSVNKFLVNLEILTLSLYPFVVDPMHFKSVGKFKVEDSVFFPENFVFSHLQELSMNCYDDKCNRWIEFLKHHSNISRFHINYSNMNDDQFNKLTDLPNLVEMSISHLQGELLEVETIVKFMENHDKLMKFALGSCQPADKPILQKHFEKQWKITDYHRCLAFERLN